LKRLEDDGLVATYGYGRYAPPKTSLVSRLFRKLSFGKEDAEGFPEAYAPHRQAFMSSVIVRCCFLGLMLPGYIVQLRRILRESRGTEVLVLDRYVLDTWALDARLGRETSPQNDLSLLRLLSKLMPPATHSFLLDVDEKVARTRRGDNLPSPLLGQAIEDYRVGAAFLAIRRLDGSQPTEASCLDILSTLDATRFR